MKIVINTCFGGYGLSEKAYAELGIEWDGHGYKYNDKRDDPELVAVVEKLGDRASGRFAELKVVDVPDGVDWYIDEYDGMEHVAETHSTWC